MSVHYSGVVTRDICLGNKGAIISAVKSALTYTHFTNNLGEETTLNSNILKDCIFSYWEHEEREED
jgi:hypothetical protein